MDRDILRQIAGKYETPSYVFHIDELKKRIAMIREILGGKASLCYAMKANPFLVKPLKDVVDKYEVCSPGEFGICETCQIPMERIVLSGVYKEEKDIAHAMCNYRDKGTYTIESASHLELLERCACKEGIRIRSLIRVTSGNQFGMDEAEICRIIERRNEYSHVNIIGLQHYSGTQKKKLAKIKKELEHLDELITMLKESYGYEAEELEYGPGFYVPYFSTDEEADDEAMLKEFAGFLSELRFQGKITLEMGRYLAAYCGCYLTAIVDQKVNMGQKYCIVDGGIHHLTYFGQAMAMKRPHYRQYHEEEGRYEEVSVDKEQKGIKQEDFSQKDVTEWNVCGSLCTVNDVIVKNLPLQQAKIGDILVFERTGAYSVTEGMYLFLSRDLPQVLFYSKSEGIKVARRRRSTDEINCIEAEQ